MSDNLADCWRWSTMWLYFIHWNVANGWWFFSRNLLYFTHTAKLSYWQLSRISLSSELLGCATYTCTLYLHRTWNSRSRKNPCTKYDSRNSSRLRMTLTSPSIWSTYIPALRVALFVIRNIDAAVEWRESEIHREEHEFLPVLTFLGEYCQPVSRKENTCCELAKSPMWWFALDRDYCVLCSAQRSSIHNVLPLIENDIKSDYSPPPPLNKLESR